MMPGFGLREHTARRDRDRDTAEQLAELLVVADRELDVARGDAPFLLSCAALPASSRISAQRQRYSRLEDRRGESLLRRMRLRLMWAMLPLCRLYVLHRTPGVGAPRDFIRFSRCQFERVHLSHIVYLCVVLVLASSECSRMGRAALEAVGVVHEHSFGN